MSSSVFLVLIGPSGAGKSFLSHQLLNKFDELEISVSVTTRAPRTGEIHGKDYIFLSKEKFEAMKNSLLEWEEVHGNFYGTPIEPILKAKREGRSLVFDIDIRGAATLKQKFPNETKVILIKPPTFEALSKRILERSAITEQELETRLRTAKREYEEFQKADFIDYTIINDKKDEALKELYELTEKIFLKRAG